MDDDAMIEEPTAGGGVFVLVRIDGDDRVPYRPFSATCGCGCGGVRGSCCCSAH